MPVSQKVIAILEQNKPSRVTPRLRRIWPDIEAFHSAGYQYKEITHLLRTHYEIEVSYKTFMSARRRILGGVTSGEEGKPEPQAVDDPLERARRKFRKDREAGDVIGGKGRKNG